jgi:hypothetical protein
MSDCRPGTGPAGTGEKVVAAVNRASSAAATAQANRHTAPAKTRAVRAPKRSDSQPSVGAPTIPDSDATIDTADTTRPRMSSRVSSCTRAATVVHERGRRDR